MTEPIFAVEHLSLAYPARRGQPAAQILSDVSFSVERGQALTLVGPSGSGKSSLLRCLNRLEEPSAGVVRFEGRDIRSLDPRQLRREAALVTQTPVLFEGTVRDNLLLRPAGIRLMNFCAPFKTSMSLDDIFTCFPSTPMKLTGAALHPFSPS